MNQKGKNTQTNEEVAIKLVEIHPLLLLNLFKYFSEIGINQKETIPTRLRSQNLQNS